MAQFVSWPAYLANHASDADIRKDTDPTESPKHYIDIDNYSEFNSTHTIPQNWDDVIAAHGTYFVNNEGILPWATLATYDSLKNAFLHYNWDKAMFFAADLGHYVADGHMPLHITKNYNGQYSGNDDIHSRYESTMIYYFNSQITYLGDTVKIIPDVSQYIFDYLYKNYTYVDSVLIADDYATTAAGSTSGSTYRNALWNKSKKFTVLLFKNASHALAELIYNAWVEAGSPPVGSVGINESIVDKDIIIQNYPNPFSISTKISFLIKEYRENVSLSIYNSNGCLVAQLYNGEYDSGMYEFNWEPVQLNNGIYYAVLNCGNATDYQKIVYIK